MRQRISLGVTALLLLGGIAASQLRKPDVKASADAILYFVGDTEHELTRMPARFAQMSDADEIQIGNELAKRYAEDNSESKDSDVLAMQQYISKVGSEVAAHAHRKLPYRFHYVRSRSFVNAFALPGGHVVIGAGLIELMDSEDELASVLGHEIEHVDHRHCAERVQMERALHKIPFGSLAAIPVEIFQAGYSKTDELEADREGVRLAASAGYSPEAAVRLFEKFDRLYRHTQSRSRNLEEEVSQVILDSISGYFRSHPLPADRIVQVRQMLATEKFSAREQERPLQTGYIVKTWDAEDKLNAHKYGPAISQSTQALATKPDYDKAHQVRAQAEFLLARFSDAATDYEKVLDAHMDLVSADQFAESLAASDRSTAGARFAEWMRTVGAQHQGFDQSTWSGMNADLAGLKLLSGSAQDAQQLTAKARANSDGDVLARIRNWEYRTGRFTDAVDLLQTAVETRPYSDYQLQLAWALIEIGKFESSLNRLNALTHSSSEAAMATAVADWRAHQPDAALYQFNGATVQDAYWKNPAWTNALYPASVTASIREMESETEKRRLAALRNKH